MAASNLGETDSDEYKFCCFYAINAEKGVFYTFNWQLHQENAMHNQGGKIVRPNAWIVLPRDEDIDKPTTTQGIKRPRAHSSREDGPEHSDMESSVDDSAEEFEPPGASDSEEEGTRHSDASRSSTPEQSSPRKRRRVAVLRANARLDQGPQILQTPTKRKASSRPVVPSPTKPSAGVAPTPHSKAMLRTRQQLKARRAATSQKLVAPEFSVTDAKTLAHLPKDAQLRAMHVLHVGSRPDLLPCREEEFTDVLEKVLVLLEDGAGGCVCSWPDNLVRGQAQLTRTSTRYIRSPRNRQNSYCPRRRTRTARDGETKCAVLHNIPLFLAQLLTASWIL